MWLDKRTNTLVYDLPADHKARVIPGAKPLSNGYLAFPATLYNLQLARWFGLSVPPPMDDYDWPGKYKPFASQQTTANFLTVHPKAFVLSDMGTGKTLSALWAADYVMQQNKNLRCLIVAPLSTLQRVWSDAVFGNMLGRRTCVVLHGSASKRKDLLAKPFDFYIVNFDGVNVIKNELLARTDIQLVIIDEASAYRDATTKRHKTARAVLAQRSYLWLMTGTPTPNGPLDSYGLAKLVNNAGGESFTHYRDRVMQHKSRFLWVPRAGAHEAAHRMLTPSIRFSIDECIDLPPCTTQARDVELTPDQAGAYRDMKNQAILMHKQGMITAVNEAVVRLKLIQISCGCVYDGTGGVVRIDASNRIRVLREVMQECSGKIIVFASLTSVINMLNSELKEFTRAVVNGETSSKERAKIFAAFEAEESPRVLIADPGTMAHGLTLVAARTIIWFGPTDRVELYLQANKRIDRPGQKHRTTIVQLAATPVEREIYRRLEAKENMQGLVLKLAKGELL